jgi:hypothetical protein
MLSVLEQLLPNYTRRGFFYSIRQYILFNVFTWETIYDCTFSKISEVSQIYEDLVWIDLSPFEWNFDLDKSGQKFHHSLKEHHKISNIPKFRCEML